MRSEKLKNYEDSTKKALEERNRRYRRWKALNTNEVPLDRGSRLGVNPKVPPTPTESTLVAAYDRTGQIQRSLPKRIMVSDLYTKRLDSQAMDQQGRSSTLLVQAKGHR